MAEINPPSYSENGCYTAQQDRLMSSSLICQEGVRGDDDLLVVPSGSGLDVIVEPGSAWIQGDNVANQGMYFVTNDADTQLSVDPSDPTDGRIDLVVAQVLDTQYVGDPSAAPTWVLNVVTGTPSPVPVPPNPPESALVLAELAVPAGTTSTDPIDLTDVRTRFIVCGSNLPGVVAGGRYGTAVNNIPNATTTLVNCGNITDHQMGGVTSVGANGGLIVPVEGWYHIAVGIRFTSGGAPGGEAALILRGNGNEITRYGTPFSGATEVTISTLAYLEENTNLQAYVNQNSGSALDTNAQFGYPYMRVARFQ